MDEKVWEYARIIAQRELGNGEFPITDREYWNACEAMNLAMREMNDEDYREAIAIQDNAYEMVEDGTYDSDRIKS